jgi:two-component system sensor histidine kinase UhpB
MPLVALHGWPGSASSPRCREQFDLAMWCTTLFDQRGCGNCYAEDGLHANTTAHLVADIEVLRRHRHVENWCVAGDCWGATLAQALPGSRLSWISGAGHDPYHPAILQAWQSALAAMGHGPGAGGVRPSATQRDARMSLRLRVNLIIAVLMTAFCVVLIWVDYRATRVGIREEIESSHRIAVQLVSQVGRTYAGRDANALADFLRPLGRVRANDIALYDPKGVLLHRSSPASYMADRSAPRWYARLVTPQFDAIELILDNGRVIFTPDASRIILDGWDDFLTLVGSAGLSLLVANLLVFYGVGHVLAPLSRIRLGLERFGAGHADERLPILPGAEVRAIALAFNRMADDVQAGEALRIAAAQSQAHLDAERRFVHDLQRRFEAERRELAGALHDEMGQSLTAIRTLARVVADSGAALPDDAREAARLLLQTAEQTHGAVHRLTRVLRPPALDRLGLADALSDLVDDLQPRFPGVQIALHCDGLPPLPEPLQISAYRIVQESLTNVLRHAQASCVCVEAVLRAAATGTGQVLLLTIADDGIGLSGEPSTAGRFGMHLIEERAVSLSGHVTFRPTQEVGGLTVEAVLPVPEKAEA